MDPKHTLFLFDMRPFKAAALHVIGECEAGRIDITEAGVQIARLAAHVPRLDPHTCARQVRMLLMANCPDRARRLVGAHEDRIFTTWFVRAIGLSAIATALGALAAFVWFIVWLAT